MLKKTLNLDIKHSLTHSIGRFFSIMCLMGLGAFGLVGLKVSGPNIDKTVHHMISQHHGADLTIIADYGLSQDDVSELQTIENNQLELGYFSDTVITNTPKSIRIFSETTDISIYQIVSGHLPQNDNEIALTTTLQNTYQIGDTFEITEEGRTPLLVKHTFTVSGFINSNEFLSTNVLGISTSGSGTLDGFAVVKPSVFNSDVYTIARLRFDDLANYNTFSKEYEDKILAYENMVSTQLKDNGIQRLRAIQQTANSKIADGQTKIDEVVSKLAKVEQQLDDAQIEIDTKQKDLTNGSTELNSQKEEVAKSKQVLDETKVQLDTSKQKLDIGKVELENGFEQLKQQKQMLDNIKVQLEQSEKTLNQAKAQLETQTNQAEHLLANQPSVAASQDITTTTISKWREQLRIGKNELQIKQQQYEHKKTQYETGKAQYDNVLAQLNASQLLIDTKQAEYNEGLKHYQNGLANYQKGLRQYLNGLAQLKNAQETLSNGQNQLTYAQKTLNKNYAIFNAEKEKASTEIETAQDDIDNAKADLMEMIEPKYHVYTRSSALGGEGYTTIQATSQGISAVGNMFPLVLYGVAALVTLTTMTRFVNEERTKAGILKALGYTNRDIYKKFIVYGLISSTTGTIIGVLAGMYLLPYVLGETLLATSVLPKMQLPFYWEIALIALLCSVLCSVVPALFIARRELKLSAATLLLPKPPTNVASILLERIPFIWRKLSFTQKVTARNIFRYKQRMLMTIFGVAGSLALLFSGLGILSSLSGMIERQYGAIIQYDALVMQHDNIRDTKTTAIQSELQNHQIKDYLSLFSTTYSQKIEGVHNPQTITMLSTKRSFDRYINLFDANSKQPLTLTNDGVYITEKIATQMNKKVGDTITLDNKYTLKISEIVEMYAGHFIFMNDKAYETFFNQPWKPNAYLLHFNDTSNDAIQQTAARFMALEGVRTVVQNTSMQKTVSTLVNSLTTVMFVLTTVSILLAVVILYNLTIINVAERIRELSTIKVLGFFNNEVTLYIYRETIILSLIGMIFGLIFGKLLHRLIIDTVATPIMMFNPTVDLWVYILPCVIITSIVTILGVIVNRHLKHIDMLKALKSVE